MVATTGLYECLVRHNRVQPLRYGFGHRTYYWLVDLGEPPRLPGPLRMLARFRSADHVGDPDRSLRENVLAFLAEHRIDIGAGRVTMLAQPRVLGYVFNPLSVFWCHDESGALAAIVAEVHNTYGGRHRYLLRPSSDPANRELRTGKEFYVSPFFTIDGEYRMVLPEPDSDLSLAISLVRGGSRPFTATMTGHRRPLTAANVARLGVRYPLHTLVISARIRWHGIRLYLKGLPVVARTQSARTSRSV
jgi:DUF1365 family protein